MEVNGTNLGHLSNVLLAAQAVENNIRIPATAKLQELQSVAGFQPCLSELVATANNVRVRFFAATALRSTLLHQVLLGDDSTMRKSELQYIRPRLIQALREEKDELVAKQLTVLIPTFAQAVELDWSQVFTALHDLLVAKEEYLFRRGLTTLHEMTTMLTDKRKNTRWKFTFESVCVRMCTILRQRFAFEQKNWMAQYSASAIPSNDMETLQPGCKRLESIAYCLADTAFVTIQVADSDYPHPVLQPAQQEVKHTFPVLLDCLRAYGGPNTFNSLDDSSLQEGVRRIAVIVAQCIVKCVGEAPHAIVPYLKQFLEFFLKVFSASVSADGKIPFESFSIAAVTFLYRVISHSDYRHPSHPAQDDPSIVPTVRMQYENKMRNEAQHVLRTTFTQNTVDQMLRTILFRVFMLKPLDAKQWREAPEQFFGDEQLISDEECLRPATRQLYWYLLKTFKQWVSTTLISLLGEMTHNQAPILEPPANNSVGHTAMLRKEAVYFALGIGCYEHSETLHDVHTSFASFYKEYLSQELATTQPGLSMLRRRIIWLIGQWIGSEPFPLDMFSDVYRHTIRLLGNQENMVVRLEAASSLRLLVDEINQDESGEQLRMFAPFIKPCCSLLAQLVADAELASSKERSLSVLRFVIEVVGSHIAPALDVIKIALPKIWDSADKPAYRVLRKDVLVCMASLVGAYGARSHEVHHFTVPLLMRCLDPKVMDRAQLESILLSCFMLFHQILRNATELTDDIKKLFGSWLSLCDVVTSVSESDEIDSAVYFHILGSYIHLGGAGFIAAEGPKIVKVVAAVLEALARRTRQLDTWVLLAVANVAEAAARTTTSTQVLMTFGPLFHIIIKFLDSHHNLVNHAQSNRMTERYLELLARMFFVDCYGSLSQQKQQQQQSSSSSSSSSPSPSLSPLQSNKATLNYMIKVVSDYNNSPAAFLCDLIDGWLRILPRSQFPYKHFIIIALSSLLNAQINEQNCEYLARIVDNCYRFGMTPVPDAKSLQPGPPPAKGIEFNRINALQVADATALYFAPVSHFYRANLRQCAHSNSAQNFAAMMQRINPNLQGHISNLL
jgi:importin-11